MRTITTCGEMAALTKSMVPNTPIKLVVDGKEIDYIGVVIGEGLEIHGSIKSKRSYGKRERPSAVPATVSD